MDVSRMTNRSRAQSETDHPTQTNPKQSRQLRTLSGSTQSCSLWTTSGASAHKIKLSELSEGRKIRSIWDGVKLEKQLKKDLSNKKFQIPRTPDFESPRSDITKTTKEEQEGIFYLEL